MWTDGRQLRVGVWTDGRQLRVGVWTDGRQLRFVIVGNMRSGGRKEVAHPSVQSRSSQLKKSEMRRYLLPSSLPISLFLSLSFNPLLRLHHSPTLLFISIHPSLSLTAHPIQMGFSDAI